LSQRDSGYARIERDNYETPEWVTGVVMRDIRWDRVWEPAAGSGKMVRALAKRCTVEASDIADGCNFLRTSQPPGGARVIITNPPYTNAEAFISHALDLTEPLKGQVMMLLRTDFDHAKTRQYLFSEHPAFAKKIVLIKRIKWFEDSTGSPSFNHAWFIWDWQHRGPPVLAYGP
jgi:hypothetical protein